MRGIDAQEKHRPHDIVSKLWQVDVMMAQGLLLAEAIRSIGVSQVTYNRWRSEFGRLKLDQAKRLKDLEQENLRLRRAVSDLTLDKRILAEGSKGNLIRPARRRDKIAQVPASRRLSERRA